MKLSIAITSIVAVAAVSASPLANSIDSPKAVTCTEYKGRIERRDCIKAITEIGKLPDRSRACPEIFKPVHTYVTVGTCKVTTYSEISGDSHCIAPIIVAANVREIVGTCGEGRIINPGFVDLGEGRKVEVSSTLEK